MKKYYLLILGWFIIANTFAQPQVSGNQSGSWTVANSPYQVVGDITIPQGQTLDIEAGVEVNFQGYYRIYVQGKIQANGTDSQGIQFTTNNTSVGWGGIRIDNASAISEFQYCTFEYGKTSATGNYPDMHGGAVCLIQSNAHFNHCTFSHNDATGDNDGMGGAVYAYNTGSATQTLTEFTNCTFEHNHAFGEGGAIKFTNDAQTNITDCTFYDNSAGYGGGAIMMYVAENMRIVNCLFDANYANNSGGGAIKTLQAQSSIYFVNCTFVNNQALGYAEGGAANLSYADTMFVNCIVYQNTQTYGDDINVGQSATAQIDNCDLIMPSNATGSNNLNNVNPQFVSNTDFHLQSGSPCIDAGMDVGLPYNGSAPDMGCYETGTGAIALFDNAIGIYPNPVAEYLFLEKTSGIQEIMISDLSGRVQHIYNGIIPSYLDVHNLAPGVYILQIKEEDAVYSRKFIKE